MVVLSPLHQIDQIETDSQSYNQDKNEPKNTYRDPKSGEESVETKGLKGGDYYHEERIHEVPHLVSP